MVFCWYFVQVIFLQLMSEFILILVELNSIILSCENLFSECHKIMDEILSKSKEISEFHSIFLLNFLLEIMWGFGDFQFLECENSF